MSTDDEYLRLRNIALENHLADERESHRISRELGEVYRTNLEIWQERATNLRVINRDLLKVCKDILEDTISDDNGRMAPSWTIVDRIRATIAKAERES